MFPTICELSQDGEVRIIVGQDPAVLSDTSKKADAGTGSWPRSSLSLSLSPPFLGIDRSLGRKMVPILQSGLISEVQG